LLARGPEPYFSPAVLFKKASDYDLEWVLEKANDAKTGNYLYKNRQGIYEQIPVVTLSINEF